MDQLKEKDREHQVEDAAPERDEVLARVLARRESHRERNIVVRVGVVIGGGLLSVFAALLSVITPEFGLPLLLVGLRTLALEFNWAARLYTKVAKLARRVGGTLRKLWPKTKAGVFVVVVGLVLVFVTVFRLL